MHAVGVAMLVMLVLVTMIAVALLFAAFLKDGAHRSER
jgi:hypothetical protein